MIKLGNKETKNVKQPTEHIAEDIVSERSIFNSDIKTKLFALEEANEYFSASLKSSDMFRLITSRINEMVPFAACALFMVEDDKKYLKIILSVGNNSRDMTNLKISLQEGLAGKTYLSRSSKFDPELKIDKDILPEKISAEFNSAITVPLYQGIELFGVLQLFGDEEAVFSKNSVLLLEAIGERVAPLLLNSFTLEKSISNAMTDSLTSFPNERAFYLVTENQIAESQRYRGKRPLTVLSIDIKNFGKLNSKYGHVAGDKILEFAATLIKTQLRQMDFMARSKDDEFLVVLPTADVKATEEIIARLMDSFATASVEVHQNNSVKLNLHFGAATFIANGETAEQLLSNARLKKQTLKSPKNSKVIWFPKDYVS